MDYNTTHRNKEKSTICRLIMQILKGGAHLCTPKQMRVWLYVRYSIRTVFFCSCLRHSYRQYPWAKLEGGRCLCTPKCGFASALTYSRPFFSLRRSYRQCPWAGHPQPRSLSCRSTLSSHHGCWDNRANARGKLGMRCW